MQRNRRTGVEQRRKTHVRRLMPARRLMPEDSCPEDSCEKPFDGLLSPREFVQPPKQRRTPDRVPNDRVQALIATPARASQRAAAGQNGISSSMSLLRAPPLAPAATARRGATLDDPLDPKSPESSEPRLPPPLRPSSMVSVELNPCSTTSVEYFSTPA